jgi:transmembrane sensor
LDELKSFGNSPAVNKARPVKPKKSNLPVLFSILLMTAFLAAGYLEYTSETLRYFTQFGEHRQIVLGDNSHLDLNTNTQVEVKISLLHRQIRLLQGEALFAVNHEWWRDFTVQADALQIRDIGTRFNVHIQPESIAVTVLEGEVELSDGQVVRHQSLLAGHQRSYSKNSGLSQQKSVTAETVTAWLDGHLVFKRTPLSEVVAELERYHEVQFVFASPELAQETVSGTFDASDLEPFLHTIKPMLSIQAKRQGQTILLQRLQKK